MVTILGLWSATNAALELRDDVLLAARRAGMADKAVAGWLDIGKSQLSDQLALRGHLSLWRCASLPREFWVQFLIVRAHRYGLRVLADDALTQLVKDVSTMMDQRKKVMASMGLEDAAEERRRA